MSKTKRWVWLKDLLRLIPVFYESFLGVLMAEKKKKALINTAVLLVTKISLAIMQIWSSFIDIRASFHIKLYASATLVSWTFFGMENVFLCKYFLLLLKNLTGNCVRKKKNPHWQVYYFSIYIISTNFKRLLIVFHTSFNTSKAKTPFCSFVFHRASHHRWAYKENKVDDFHWNEVGTKEVQNWGPRRDWYCYHRWSFFGN